MEKGATLTLSLPCNTNKKLPMLLDRTGIENANGVLHNGMSHSMSLFQDLKLKRRKVDSRCSSDGESIGTSESASSLSPDAQPLGGEGSPKEKERCLTPEELIPPGAVSKSNGFPSQFFFMMKNEGRTKTSNNNNYESLKGLNGIKLGSGTTVTTTANVVVVKSEPGDSARSSPSSSPGLEGQRKNPLKRREGSPLKEAKSPQRSNGHSNGHITITTTTTNGSSNGHHNGNGHGNDSESVASIKSEKIMPDGDKEMMDMSEDRDEKMDQDEDVRGVQSLSSSPRSMLSSASSTGSRGSPPRTHHHQGMISSPRRSPPQIHRENPSTLIITKANKGDSYSQRSSPMSHHSSSNSNGPSRGGSPPQQIMNPHLNHHNLPPHMTLGGHHPPPGMFHANQLHARLTENRNRDSHSNGSPMAHIEIRSLSNQDKSEPPLSVVTSTSLSFHQGSMYRINGVRPEVISGGAVTPVSGSGPTSSNGTSASTLNPQHQLTQQQQLQQHHQQQQQLLPNGTGPHSHQIVSNSNGHTMSNGHIISNHHLAFQGPRKSPSSQLSRSPNSSPSNSSSSGSIQHSPGSNCSAGGTIIAGGSIGMVNSSTNANSTHHVNLSRTPTVIMGEAGGVRTMLWSQPGQNISNPALEIGLGGSGGTSPPGSGTSISSVGSSNGSNSYGSHTSNGNGQAGNPVGNGHPAMQKGVLSMERLWATEALNPLNLSTGASNTTNGHGGNIPNSLTNGPQNNEDDDYEQPMICMICEDRATGLHYGIITCEGCKGFFKRTVQNRRVYTCVADGTCEITKAQRNRCQYCRFKKCIEQGMVLQAVREDRMPGGRNSGAVYNLYKVPVKYRKHKKGARGAANGKGDKTPNNNNSISSNNNNINSNPNSINGNSNSATNLGIMNNNSNNNNNNNTNNSNGQSPQSNSMLPPQNGNILMAALTSPNEVIARRQHMPFDQAANMINSLVQCDNFHDIAALHNWEELLEARGDLSEKLCQMGDSIVYRLVQWTKRLPFYSELPVEVHTRVLTHKWHELLVLTTSAWHAMHSPPPPPGLTAEEETMENLQILQRCLQAMMGRSLTLEQLKQDVGQMVERLTYLTRTFRRLGIRLEEYVSLKVIAMLQNTGTKANEVSQIQERYIKVLRTFLEMTVPSQPNRLTELLRCLPEVQAAASLLLESKMFYVPFLLNSALLQR